MRSHFWTFTEVLRRIWRFVTRKIWKTARITLISRIDFGWRLIETPYNWRSIPDSAVASWPTYPCDPRNPWLDCFGASEGDASSPRYSVVSRRHTISALTRADDFFEARIAAERVPHRIHTYWKGVPSVPAACTPRKDSSAARDDGVYRCD
jgi:hypothetical protein